MPVDINIKDIQNLLDTAKVTGFTGKCTALGGGEVNDTLILDCSLQKVILRITRYHDVNTLKQEARALSLIDTDQAPKLLYFNEENRIKDRAWILETYISGKTPDSLTIEQFESIGELLAKVHEVKSEHQTILDYWNDFLEASVHFGDEAFLLSHPDERLKTLINRARDYFKSRPAMSLRASLIHGDVTLNNMLANESRISLIDWEFSKFKDPMSDFSTMFYEDMEYNKGKWRVHIKDNEREALLGAYKDAGGHLNYERLKVWLNLDKLGAAVYLYWKLYQSNHEMKSEQLTQYKLDLSNLMNSLEKNI
jgi:aminoglycoside phosphotransferase (APT) family kinase protein